MNRRPLLLLAALALAACSDSAPIPIDAAGGSAETEPPAAPPETAPDGTIVLSIDPADAGAAISPLIRGVSGDLDRHQMADAGVALNSWGGNPASRFNYEIGHAWNAAADWEYRNTNYGASGDAFRSFVEGSQDVAVRVVVPTLGWIARNDDQDTCSFPDDDGGCTGDDGHDCENPGPVADPERANVRSTSDSVAAWIGRTIDSGLDVRFIAMDNEPELWGQTHYDVHPQCPEYEEILDTYLEYAGAIRGVAPDAELTGPVMCCWFDYWRTAPGPADGSEEHDFLAWFLGAVRRHDEEAGTNLLDVVDVHYYPQSEVFNDDTDDETNARRLRSTRSLWDVSYVDESWIREPIAFIPRMQHIIEQSYPGKPLMISEWNFGADTTMNGALAIADVLGIYGREGVYAAAYWRSPPPDSPGYFAFKMHGDYAGDGRSFVGRSIPVGVGQQEQLSAYAALDEAEHLLRVMVINKDPDESVPVRLGVGGDVATTSVDRWTYGQRDLGTIVHDVVEVDAPVVLEPYSISVVEVPLS